MAIEFTLTRLDPLQAALATAYERYQSSRQARCHWHTCVACGGAMLCCCQQAGNRELECWRCGEWREVAT